VSYLVFARKYRPKQFDEVVGQEHVAHTLQNAIAADRLAHAYLLCGPRGVGKTTMARLLAKAVNCPDESADPAMAAAILQGNDVDVIEIDAASNRKVEDVEPLVDATRYLPQRATHKIFIVDEAHMLSRHAWNALLKTLEEPPPHVLFIFATTEPQKVLETVRSRCQRFDFKRISPDDIAGKLKRIAEAEGVAVDDDVFREIASRAVGGMRDAESMFDQALASAPSDRALNTGDLVTILGGIPRELRSEVLALARGGDMGQVLDKGAAIVEAGADPAELLRDLYGDLRDAAVASARGAESGLGVEWCLAAAEVVARHQKLAIDSRATRATMDLALLALARLGDVADLEDIARRLEGLAAGGADVRGAPAPESSKPAPRIERVKAGPLPPPSEPAPAPPNRPERTDRADKRTDDRPRLRLGRAGPRPEQRAAPEGSGESPDGSPDGSVEQPAKPVENTRPASKTLTGEELARIRNHPRVRDVFNVFGGQIEQVRRTDG
jgi:DNA polymerase-3 subunit gamma/tau